MANKHSSYWGGCICPPYSFTLLGIFHKTLSIILAGIYDIKKLKLFVEFYYHLPIQLLNHKAYQGILHIAT